RAQIGQRHGDMHGSGGFARATLFIGENDAHCRPRRPGLSATARTVSKPYRRGRAGANHQSPQSAARSGRRVAQDGSRGAGPDDGSLAFRALNAAGEDLDAYPRQLAADQAALESEGVALLWAPTVDQMYPAGFATNVGVSG
ncbi:hypothetical protein E4T56_gene18697, partial [Termitomyces sp. T112]